MLSGALLSPSSPFPFSLPPPRSDLRRNEKDCHWKCQNLQVDKYPLEPGVPFCLLGIRPWGSRSPFLSCDFSSLQIH